jgi:hypothetical protein
MRFCSCLLLALVLAVPAFGHDLIGPPYVLADLQGHFSYDLSLVVTTATQFGSTFLDGADNTDVEVWIDGFCLETMTPGTSLIAVSGNLVNDSANGTVVSTVNLCDDWTGTVTTMVVPFPVGTEARTWGTVKSMYR